MAVPCSGDALDGVVGTGEAGHLGVANLGDQRHRAGCARVRFEDEHLAVFDAYCMFMRPHTWRASAIFLV